MKRNKPFVALSGIVQDGGYPHSGCNKRCCKPAWKNPALKKHVSCLAVVDPASGESWLIDATPDFPEQLFMLNKIAPGTELKGIILTHGHIGHYTGLINLGKEIMNTNRLPVYAALQMSEFLSRNLPWKLLIERKNIKIKRIKNSISFKLNKRIKITPLKVPHRDEFTETLGFRIEGEKKSVLYIPDIDSWEKWNRRIEDEILHTSRLYIDGTFYNHKELPGRKHSEIPHPLIEETIEKLIKLPQNQKNKIHFIHLNHTNPALKQDSPERIHIEKSGFLVSEEGDTFAL